MRRFSPKWLAVALLVVMAVLMIGSALDNSATVDETAHLAAGFSFWKGYRYQILPNHPALSQMLEAAPLLFMNVKISEDARAILTGELGYAWTVPWLGPPCSVEPLLPPGCKGSYVQLPPIGDVMVRWQCPSGYLMDNWYYWAVPECQMFGKILVYGGANDGDAMMLAGRLVQIGLTLLTGVLVFLWTRRVTQRDDAALLALAVWAFHPIALAYGPLTNTDIGVTLGMTLALYFWARFLDKPTQRLAILCGVATGVALTMKFTAIILAPIYVVTVALSWKRLKLPALQLAKLAGVSLLAMWAVILVVYFPRWTPVRAPTDVEVAVLNIPGWFRAFRVLLIPPDFFKVIAMALGHSQRGHEAYLMGQWSHEGWWYYFPVSFVLKSPVAFVILMVACFVVFVRQFKSASSLEYMTWLATALYLLSAMTSHVNIGVRHVLPILPLLCVGIGCASARVTDRKLRIVGATLVGWQALVVLAAYPLYIQFFSEAVGGATDGYKYLIDSNYDWGQDAKRLKKFLDERGIQRIYLDYFGTQYSIDYLKIPNTRVSAETAKQIQQGILVVSVSELLHPEWDWLRESRQPIARVANTLFVYEIK